jgi:thiol-disulfide isomerase/thioredoxin
MVSKKKFYSLVFLSLNIGSFVEYAKWWNAEIPDGRHYVLVSAEWCEPCQKLKKELRRKALANGIDIVILDVDRHPDLAKRINPGGQIPLFLEYTKADEKWTVRKFDGQDLGKFVKGE